MTCAAGTPRVSPRPAAGRSSGCRGEYVEPPPTHDDLLALANAVREAGKPRLTEHPSAAAASGQVRHADESASGAVETGRRGHLRVLRDL